MVLAALVLTAGCLGGDPTSETTEDGEENRSPEPEAHGTEQPPEPNGTGAQAQGSDRPSVYRFDGPNLTRREVWNGQFPYQELPAVATYEGAVHRYPLEGLPRDVPIELNVTLTYEPLVGSTGRYVEFGELYLAVDPDGADTFAVSKGQDMGVEHEKRLNTVVVPHGEQVPVLEVEARGPHPEFPGLQDPAYIHYTMRATVSSISTAAPPEMPVSVPLPEDPGSLRVRSLGPSGSSTGVMVWHPGSGQAAHLEASTEPTPVPGLGEAGERVVLLTQPPDPIVVRSGSTPGGALAPLNLTTTTLETKTLDPFSEATWSLDADRAPAEVGVKVRAADQTTVWESTATGPALRGEVTSEQGAVLSFEDQRSFGVLGYEKSWWSRIGDGNHAAGEYEVVVEVEEIVSTDLRVTPVFRFVNLGEE